MTNKKSDRPTINVFFHPTRFPTLNIPRGWLVDNAACHALWYYATLTKKNIEHRLKDIQYEDEERERGFHADQFKLFKSVADMYGVAPEQMLKFWRNIDMQILMMGGDKLPSGVRFDAVPEIKTQ